MHGQQNIKRRPTEANVVNSKRLSIICFNILGAADPGGCVIQGVGLLPPGSWDCGFKFPRTMDVCCESCVLSRRGIWVGLITRPEEYYRVCCDWFDREASTMRRPWPTRSYRVMEKKNLELSIIFADPTRVVPRPTQPVLSPWLVIQRQCNWVNETVDMPCVYVFVMLILMCSSLGPVANNNYWNSYVLVEKLSINLYKTLLIRA